MGRYSEIRENNATSSTTTTGCSTTVRHLRKMSCFEAQSDKDSSPDENYGFGKLRTYTTNSLPRAASASVPRRGCGTGTTTPGVFDNVSPDQISTQMTLIDSELFRKIDLDELISCGWLKKNKHQTAPSVLNYTRRFNHVSYWVVEEILNVEESAKSRAELISYFIRVCKRLYDLNNLHSLFAVVSALRSASIYRLKSTWALVPRKDKQSLEKFVDLFSDNDNWAKLREHLNSLRLPCIPYIGVYLTDLVYLGMAQSPSSGLDDNVAANNIFRIVTTYQSGSSYNHLPRDYNLQAKLRSVRYIDELLKFVEDYNYKKSLQLEPPPQSTTTHTNHPTTTSLSSPSLTNATTQVSPGDSDSRNIGGHGQDSQPSSPTKKFVPGHKKSNSWIQRIPWIKKTV